MGKAEACLRLAQRIQMHRDLISEANTQMAQFHELQSTLVDMAKQTRQQMMVCLAAGRRVLCLW